MAIKEFKSFRHKVVKFKVKERLLFRRISKNILLRRAVDGEEHQKEVVKIDI